MRTLHATVILSVLSGLLCGPALAEMDQETCRRSAGLEDAIAYALRRQVKAVEGISKPMALERSTHPELREQAQRVVAAQAAYLANARAYAEEVEGLALQYRRCAR